MKKKKLKKLIKKEVEKQLAIYVVADEGVFEFECWYITHGKKYRVVKEEESHFTIINDYGKEDTYHKDWLKKCNR